MALTLLSLKWRYFLASFKGNVWVIVGFILGGLYGLGIVSSWTFASLMLGFEETEPQTITLWLVGFGTVLSLAWWLVPLFTSGTDATLDPDHLAPYPLRPREIMVGQLLGGFVGLTGFLTLLAVLGTGLATLSKPLVFIFYLVVAALGLVLMISVSRIFSLIAIELNSIPVVRQVLLILGFLLLLGAGPLIVASAFTLQTFYDSLPVIAEVAGWTPLASAFSAVAAAYEGAWGMVLLKLALTCIYAVLAWLLWKKLLVRAMERIGTLRGDPVAKTVEAGKLGIFDRFPATPTGAIAARTVHSLIKDPRMNMNLVMVPGFYLLFSLFGRISFSDGGDKVGFNTNWFMLVFIPIMAGYVYAYLVSYDNSAFSMHVLAGVSGKADRWGRAWGLLIIMLPLVAAGTIFMTFMGGNLHLLAPLLGLSLGLVLSGVGVSAVADMNISIPAPPPGASPFKTQRQSDGFAKGLLRMLVMLIILICGVPGLILLVLATGSDSQTLGWASAAVSLVVGVVVLVVGIHLGARSFEKNAPETLQRVSAFY
ncbi:hypothetical protein [Rothia aerolata]|uniref:Transporter n=1 Tax=Rothia aerolata TaxID=1812262 RepID=A0A917IQ04_9MICC|nr:hypothetical protein [Rothia aerolata]GGH59099.1 hypothetical protein GCM10007359_05970 [Rothia aerolata]